MVMRGRSWSRCTCRRSGQVRQCDAELGLAGVLLVAAHRPDRDGDPVRAGDLLGFQVDVELVLGELPARRDGWLDLRHCLDPGVVEAVQDLSGAVGGVAIDRSASSSPASARSAGSGLVRSAIRSATGSTSPVLPGGDRDRGDDLTVRIDGDVTLVAVEAAVVGLVPVPGLGVDGRDHPVLGDPAGDAHHPGCRGRVRGPGPAPWPTAAPPDRPARAGPCCPSRTASRA